jgi:hypothetical protein
MWIIIAAVMSVLGDDRLSIKKKRVYVGLHQKIDVRELCVIIS